MTNQVLTGIHSCLPEIDAQKKEIADRLTDRQTILSAWQGAAEIRQVLRNAPRADRQWFVKFLEGELCRD